MAAITKNYLTVITAEQLQQANIEARLRTSNYYDLFYAGMTTDGETITNYVSHHPFGDKEAQNMAEYFQHFYDMSETTKEQVFATLGLTLLPIEDEMTVGK